jgi:hypothetical protein
LFILLPLLVEVMWVAFNCVYGQWLKWDWRMWCISNGEEEAMYFWMASMHSPGYSLGSVLTFRIQDGFGWAVSVAQIVNWSRLP